MKSIVERFVPNTLRILRLRTAFSLALLLLAISQCQSQYRPPQVDLTDKDTVGYTFVQQDANQIENAGSLDAFFQKLYFQRTQGGRRISIVHIGDSHVLGDYLTKEVRRRLQDAFGDAGRGFVFPYRLAGTNGPRDFLVETNCRWRGSNCQRDLDVETPYGVSGFCLETNNANGQLSFRLRDTATAETRMLTKVTVFQQRHVRDFNYEIRDEISGQKAAPLITGDFSKSFYFDRPVSQFTLAHRRQSAAPKSFCLDGISIENEMSGVLYHAIGVNGAKYSDFSRAKYFARQVGDLNPDLIILSFGTNEAQGKVSSRLLYVQIEMLVNQLLEHAPGAAILLTTPADSYLRGRGLNPNMADVSATIRRFAKEKRYAVWDLYQLGGGENSAQIWKSQGLLSSDSVHFSKTGYAMQGKLLYQSLIQAYNSFIEPVLPAAVPDK